MPLRRSLRAEFVGGPPCRPRKRRPKGALGLAMGNRVPWLGHRFRPSMGFIDRAGNQRRVNGCDDVRGHAARLISFPLVFSSALRRSGFLLAATPARKQTGVRLREAGGFMLLGDPLSG